MYTAAVLVDTSRQQLIGAFQDIVLGCGTGLVSHLTDLNYCFVTAAGEKLPHHMTMNMGKLDTNLNPASCLGYRAILSVDSFFIDHEWNVCAAKVIRAVTEHTPIRPETLPINSVNDAKSHKHITMCVREPGKPFHSNKINWEDNTPYQTGIGRGRIVLPEPLLLFSCIEECQ
jgi:hypothetical protein